MDIDINDMDIDINTDMNNMDTAVIILAGGLGKRMNSEIPKVLHRLNNKPMLVHVIDAAIKIRPKKICIVVGKHYDVISNCVAQHFNNQVFSDFIRFPSLSVINCETRSTPSRFSFSIYPLF